VCGASKERHAEELAHHYLRGAPAERADDAVRYAVLAGDHAVARAAYGHATILYRAAVDALPLATDQTTKARLLVRLGSALGRDGRLGEAGHVFREAAAFAPSGDAFVRDVPALRSSFEKIIERAPEVTSLFYDRLFSEHPDLRALFVRNAPTVQAKMMNDTLLAIIDRLEDAPWLQSGLAALGARHATYGVTDEMYPRVGASLLATLAEAAGPEVWTPAVADAWAQAFAAITSMMLDGAKPRRRSAA
jgi:hemoglobin-like flavoprotein